MLTESDSIKNLKGIGDKAAESFAKAEVDTIGDLLMYLPYRYDSYSEPISDLENNVGKVVAVKGIIASSPVIHRTGRLTSVTCAIAVDGQKINAIWFNMPYIKNQLNRGETFIFRGKLSRSQYGYGFEQPSVHKEHIYMGLTGSLQPVYRLGNGLTQARLRGAIKDAVETLSPNEDYLPKEIKSKYGLGNRFDALKKMHFPHNQEELLEARKRIVFDEFLQFILGIRALREDEKHLPNTYDFSKNYYASTLVSKLPYKLTGAQTKVLAEIQKDLISKNLMNRLIQGDVGSGKTILAMLALIQCAENGYQGALMAPTEVLARQHYENFSKMFEDYDIPFKPVLLTGSMTAKEKREVNALIESHEADIVIGTHALFQKGVTYDNLALVITDEQHRFGVKQREALSKKGGEPHVIVMSATPIPRTLALIIYGDLDISILDEMPANRLPIKNCVVDTSYRAKAYEFIRSQIREGHQAYVVCPMITSDDDVDGENVIDYTERLRSVLPPAVRVEFLHGKMKPSDKNDIMNEFLEGKINVLVSTTVIEVGVDVSNATVMMIEDAEKFGLAQLHQLRGRVGRGDAQSYCIFINGSGDKNKAERLDILNHSNDGFKIAEEDLKYRGPGDVFGIRQSGSINFAIGDIFTDSNILKIASEAAEYLMETGQDKTLAYLKKGLILSL